MDKNIVLIGMPSSGKSTVGHFLSEKLEMGFVDTDLLISDRGNRPLGDIVSSDGLQRFLDIQEEVILALEAENSVIATGGGVIYGHASMRHLREKGVVFFLKTAFSDIEKRVDGGRRLARNNGQSLLETYNERLPLYTKYADYTVECDGRQVEEIAAEIEKLISNIG